MHVGESDFYKSLSLPCLFPLLCCREVEIGKSKPKFAGKLNFYAMAVNKQMNAEQNNPMIGILICKEKDDVVAGYVPGAISQTLGIAEYKLTKVLRGEFKSGLVRQLQLEKLNILSKQHTSECIIYSILMMA